MDGATIRKASKGQCVAKGAQKHEVRISTWVSRMPKDSRKATNTSTTEKGGEKAIAVGKTE